MFYINFGVGMFVLGINGKGGEEDLEGICERAFERRQGKDEGKAAGLGVCRRPMQKNAEGDGETAGDAGRTEKAVGEK